MCGNFRNSTGLRWLPLVLDTVSRCSNHCCVLANLLHEVKEITVSVRPVRRFPVFQVADVISRRMKVLDRGIAEMEI